MAKKFLTPINVTNLSSDPVSASEGDIYYNTVSDALKIYANGVWGNAGGGSGTVTSVGVSVPTGLSVANSPITTSGTIAISLASGYTIPTTAALDAKAPLASPTFTGTVTAPLISLTTADTATASSHYIVETASDGIIRPKTLANVQAEVVTNTTMQSNIVSPTAAGSNGIRKITMSTSAPTGGSDGDVWIVYQ